MKLGLREANQRFSQAMKAVRRGEEVILTERGNAIAVITPLEREDPDDETAVVRRLADAGLVLPAVEPGPMPTPRWRPVPVAGKPVSETVLDGREERA